MRDTIRQMILSAANQAHVSGVLPADGFPDVVIERPRAEGHGDFATNFAMISAKGQRMAPHRIAQAIVDHLEDADHLLQRTEIAGPGFINFFVRVEAWAPLIFQILQQDRSYGSADIGRGRNVQVEFVSANPTGPLHVGHGRGAAVGDSVANLLAFCGFDVQREYYINDSGRQIQTLGRSVYLRACQLLGQAVDFPEDCYQGDYINDLARCVIDEKGRDVIAGDTDAVISHCARFAADTIIAGIRNDLDAFGVCYDEWFSEQTLYDQGHVDQVLEELKARKLVYANDDAWWFNTSKFGDEKDRVVVRRNGQTTYFASDIAYHQNKYQRGFDRVIDVWGADHHGYIGRVRAAVEATGHQKEQFEVILVQLVNLLRDGQPVAMSTRAGEFVTLADVVGEVGRDAARFLFLTRDYESPLDFDLEVAKQKSNDNPVYYVQYVHARIASILRKAAGQGIRRVAWRPEAGLRLNTVEDVRLIKTLTSFPEVVRTGALALAPHRIAFYLMELASQFHTYYNKHRVLGDDAELTYGRLSLVLAVKTVIRNGLNLLGVGAPDRM